MYRQSAQTGSLSSAGYWRLNGVGAAALAHSSYHSDGRCETLVVLMILRAQRRAEPSTPVGAAWYARYIPPPAEGAFCPAKRQSVLSSGPLLHGRRCGGTSVPHVSCWMHGQWLRSHESYRTQWSHTPKHWSRRQGSFSIVWHEGRFYQVSECPIGYGECSHDQHDAVGNAGYTNCSVVLLKSIVTMP